MLAVFVSLYLARDKSGSKIDSLVCKAKLSDGVIILDGMGNLYEDIKSEEFVAVRIHNKGFFPVIIPFQFQFLSVPFSKYDRELHSHLDASLGLITHCLAKFFRLPICPTTIMTRAFATVEKKFPFKIEAKSSEVFLISKVDSLKQGLKEFNKFQLSHIRWNVMTSDAEFKAKISRSLKNEIINTVNSDKK